MVIKNFKILMLCLFLCFSCWGCDFTMKTIKVNSDPQGAKIYCDGKLMGVTPCEFKLDAMFSYSLVAEPIFPDQETQRRFLYWNINDLYDSRPVEVFFRMKTKSKIPTYNFDTHPH